VTQVPGTGPELLPPELDPLELDPPELDPPELPALPPELDDPEPASAAGTLPELLVEPLSDSPGWSPEEVSPDTRPPHPPRSAPSATTT